MENGCQKGLRIASPHSRHFSLLRTFVGPLDPAEVQAEPGTDQPNFVVILSDDHRADFIGDAGHPFIETPAMDRLAADSVGREPTTTANSSSTA